MSSASVHDNTQVAEEGDSSNVNPHVEPDVVTNPGGSGSGSGSEQSSGQGAGSASSHQRSGSDHHQRSDRNQSSPPEGGHSNMPGDQPQNAGGNAGNIEQPSSTPVGGGAGDDLSGVLHPSERQTEARERAVMIALGLIEEANDIMQISGSIRLAGQSKLEAKRLLDNVKSSIIELMRLKVPDNDEMFPRLKKARKDMQRLLMQADEDEDSATMRAMASRPHHRTVGPSQLAASLVAAQELGTGLQYTLAMRQLDCEIN